MSEDTSSPNRNTTIIDPPKSAHPCHFFSFFAIDMLFSFVVYCILNIEFCNHLIIAFLIATIRVRDLAAAALESQRQE